MDSKLRQVSRLLKRYDSDLFPKRFLDGTLCIMRKRRDWVAYRWKEKGITLWCADDWDDLVLPCTDTWIETGRPVEWGIEPILAQIQKQDAWRDDRDYDRFVEARNQRKQNKERAFKNDLRALAADCRREFAQATNDINTSTLDKGAKWRL